MMWPREHLDMNRAYRVRSLEASPANLNPDVDLRLIVEPVSYLGQPWWEWRIAGTGRRRPLDSSVVGLARTRWGARRKGARRLKHLSRLLKHGAERWEVWRLELEGEQ